MKTLIIIFAALLVPVFAMQSADALCLYDADWPEKPCYAFLSPGLAKEKLEWEKYYLYKGQEWMEQKKAKMMQEVANGTLAEWLAVDDYRKVEQVGTFVTENRENNNVWYYYYLSSQVPDSKGKFVYENHPRPLVVYSWMKHSGSEIDYETIDCNYDLVLLQRPDGRPACVTYKTGQKMLERQIAICPEINFGRGHPCGPHSSGVVPFDKTKYENKTLGSANKAESSRHCSLAPEPGMCKASIEKFYFDWESYSCKPFIWGGCGGVVPFDTLESCQVLCS